MKLLAHGLAALALLFYADVNASYITMATDFLIVKKEDGLLLTVTTQNLGDEPAYGIQFEVQAGQQEFVSASVSQLGVNQKASSDFPIDNVFRLPGHYPVLIKTHYQDANAYPFTALAVGFYDFEYPVVSKVLVRAENVNIPANGKGTISFTVRNNDSVARELDITLHLPDELAVLQDKDQITIAPKGSESVRYTVENFSALENSAYAVTLVAEYEDGKYHYSAAGSGIIRIVASSFMAGYSLWTVLAAAGVLLVLLVVVILVRRKQG
ncbi:MAG: hypothetical protein V3R51_07290 [Gammaproteobacteria bacterium]